MWFMRQAGRSLPEYRKVREGVAMLDSCRRPDLVTEITLQPVRRYGVDAAIFYSDIVVPLAAAGVEPEYLAIVSPDAMEPVAVIDGDVLAAVAARVGSVPARQRPMAYAPWASAVGLPLRDPAVSA